MADIDDTVKETLSDVRKVGANYEEQEQEVALDIPVDLVNFKKFPVVEPPGKYKKAGHDTRSDINPDDSLELPDYSGPFNQNLRFSDFSNDALVNMLEMADEYYRVCIDGWANAISERYGFDDMRQIQSEAWQNQILPQLRGMIDEWMELTDDEAGVVVTDTHNDVTAQIAGGGVVLVNPYKPGPEWSQYSKERLVKLALGSHEYLLLAIESWALAIVLRDGLDEMFAFNWTLWSETLLPAAMEVKARWMGISGDKVESFMKDIQVDATSFPGKAFEMTFEMPEVEVGIFTFNKCVSVDQWEALGRPDIAEKASHITCPAAIIETAKMYNPNMKVEILAIPPRVSKDEVCCKWRLSIRDESDPEYTPVRLTRKSSTR
jgi:hypothetical protein